MGGGGTEREESGELELEFDERPPKNDRPTLSFEGGAGPLGDEPELRLGVLFVPSLLLDRDRFCISAEYVP